MTATTHRSGEPAPLAQVNVVEQPLSVELASAAHDEARDAYVRGHPQATFFHQSEWRNAIAGLYGHKPRELMAWRGGEVAGVLPMMLCRGLRGARNLVSIPYAVYGGPLASAPEIEDELIRSAHRLGEELGVGHVELRYLREPRCELPKSTLYWTFIRDLPEKSEDVLARMPKKARAEARKARKRHDLELAEGEWYLDDLVRLFLLNKHGLGSPGLPARHFRRILHGFGRDVHVHVVRHEREVVGTVMSFGFRETLIAYYAGTRPGADRTVSVSNFMYTALQEWAVEKGYRRFDFCRSRADSGAFRFKVHQGFEPQQLHYCYDLIKDRSIPSFTPSNPKTQILRRTWTKLPLWTARRLSNRLAKYLP